jgi:hypothetical protein
MTDCKHDWHFIEGTERLQCRRCKAETGPRTYDQRVQDMLQDVTVMGSAWSKDGERIDPLSVYRDFEPAPVREPVAYLCENAVGHKYFRWKKPSSEFKPTALYITPPAAPDLQAELDATNRQVEILSDALAESRREVEALKAVQEVSWGVDWGKAGDKSCAMIIKRLPDGKIEVVAVEYEP